MAWYIHGKSMFLNPSQVTVEAPFLLLSDIIRVSLHDSDYIMNTDSDEFWSESGIGGTTPSEIVATNYDNGGGGVQLGSKAVTRNFASDRAEFDAADLVYSSIGNGTNATFTDIIIFRTPTASTGSGDDWNLIAHDDTFSATTTNGGDITLVWNSAGILHIT